MNNDTSPRTTKPRAAILGLLSAAMGLAAGEITAGLFQDLPSPIISVGDKAIDLVPVPLKNFAIETFGTKDKVALVVGIVAAIAIFAAVVGILTRTRRVIGVVALAGFGLVGAAAAVTGRTGTGSDAIPSIVAGIVAIAALLGTLKLAEGRRTTRMHPHADGHTDHLHDHDHPHDHGSDHAHNDHAHNEHNEHNRGRNASGISRGRFLAGSGAMAAAATGLIGFGRQLQSATGAAAARTKAKLGLPKEPLPIAPASITAEALTVKTPFFTPNKDFYRIDTALVVPKIDVNDWKLTIKGMVKTPLTFTYEQLLNRDLVERDITLTCVSNEVGGILMGTARWVGVPLRELLAEAGVDETADQIVGRSVDGWTSGFPVAAVNDGRDAIVALSMNGEPLPFKHGFPARLVVPGLYGYVSATKWLTEIELTTFDKFDAYWVPRGYAQEAPIKFASRIDVPQGLATVAAGKTALAGVAWAQTVGIKRVELRIDGGEWIDAELADAQSNDTWRQWSYAWDATPGNHEIVVRATDNNDKLQTEERVAPLPNGATGWHSIIVFVS
jgi:DMSO/TMAO reductase YedYZ molybdopterin-dependent catalytic subunit